MKNLFALFLLAALVLAGCDNAPVVPGVVRVASVTVAPESVSLDIDKTLQLTATVLPANAENRTVTWKSDKPAVATVDEATGLVKAVSAGTATITVTTVDGGKTGLCTVTVNPVPVASVTVSPATLTLEVGETSTLEATVLPEKAGDKTVTWSTDKPAVATVNPSTGEVKAISEGTATITATSKGDSGKSGKCVVTVNPEPVPVVSVTVEPGTLTLDIGETSALKVTVEPENADDTSVSWSTDKPAVVTVDPSTGEVKALSDGTATITATAQDGSGRSGRCVVTVLPEFDVLSAISDSAFKSYCQSMMGEWDTNKNGRLSEEEAAAVTIMQCGGASSDNQGEIVSLAGIEYFTGLTWLSCPFNRITALDLSKNLKLTTLNCYGNQLTALDLSKLTALTTLDCHGNQITALDLSKNLKLTILSCYGNQLTALDLSKLTALTMLECSQNWLSSLDLSKNTALEQLYCTWNNLARLDISKNTALTELVCWDNPGDGVSKFYVRVWFEGQNPPFEMRFPTWQSSGRTITIEYITGDFPPPPTNDYYTSTDYSRDGRVTTLQTATVGTGVDVVLMGDGYSDRLIANGTYSQTMNFAMESLFTEEPYKSFRNMFNVYSVDVVSKNEVFEDDSITALEVVMDSGSTRTEGNDTKVINYALKAISTYNRMDNAVLVVMVNSTSWHGTCGMYYPQSSNDHGDGLSISYFSKGEDNGQLRQLLHHEVNGHGFPKLGDEYWYDDNATIPSETVTKYRNQSTWGWNKNIDFTSNTSQVKWARFLADSRYSGQGLGVFQGGYYYGKGVWRATFNSIMRYNYGGFNAPSREAIYYRIHKLAYGASWTYDYETFVAWDINHYTAPTGTPAGTFGVLRSMPHTPPVVIPHSWRETMRR
jgi:uncharacterized protein YjdB